MLKEVSSSLRADGGSTLIDDAYRTYIKGRVPNFETWVHEKPLLYAKLMQSWEKAKRQFTGKEPTGLSVDMPRAILKYFVDDEDEEEGFLIPNAAIQSFYQPSLVVIKGLVDKMLTAVPNSKVIFLVGGLGQSQYIIHEMMAQYTKGERVVFNVPRSSEVVMHGSLILGLGPVDLPHPQARTITYGISIADFADPADPASLITVLSDGRKVCRERFKIFVSAGQLVTANETVRHQFRPDKLNIDVTLNIYSSKAPKPRYTSNLFQPDVKLVATIKLQTSAMKDFGMKGIEVQVVFGDSVTEFRAVDIATGTVAGPAKVKLEI